MRTRIATPWSSLAASIALACAAAACSHEYVYRPVTSTSAEIAGRAAASYAIPPEAPRGDVRIASFGFTDLAPQDDSSGGDIRALHVREVVSNESQATWTVDTREQRLSLPDAGESRPAYASADPTGTAPPLVTVPPGGKRTIDLFFPLPERFDRAKELPAFDAIWKVQTDTRLVATRTPFERIELVPVYRGDPYYDYPYGPYWYDPGYRYGAFVGVGPRVYVRHPVVLPHGGFHRDFHEPRGRGGGHRR